ncbi:hypothetical protein D1155_11280 [Anaerotruncus sp. 80]|uniref:DUF6017 domain-containing protein n=1 Tax=Anaerotruncus colihominis TaxID=169435 RepID=A0A845QMD1_9FIRM|nr:MULTISPECIES: DUF6017 domain-containing protein [Anaerotruncus]NBH62231.1 hypothetical protein [Anaerotruncus colihominis]NCF02886.1 hypothetical protein [Anaerotruncus sp. 80]
MGVIRVEKNRNYTVMSNYHLRDKRMSLKAKGLLSYMLSCSDEWNFTVRGLEVVLKEGRDCIRAALEELQTLGYLVRVQQRTEKGNFDKIDYVVYEHPRDIAEQEEKREGIEKPELSPCTENPSTVKSKAEDPSQRNTKSSRITKKNNYQKHNLSVEVATDLIKEQIDYTKAVEVYDMALIDNLVDIMTELKCLSACQEMIRIGKVEYPSDLISRKLEKVRWMHIEYVVDCFKQHTDKIKNIKSYLQQSLLNAPDTIDAYYTAEVQHDFYGRG